MAKVILICGKICSGKSYYAKSIRKSLNAVILSTDEVTYDLTRNEQGEGYPIFAERVNRYLRKKAVEICRAGANVILDWGFWTNEDRLAISAYLALNKIPFEWHYMDISDELWHQNIDERNARIQAGQGGSDFLVDEGLLEKLLSRFEVPDKSEIDVWVQVQRNDSVQP